jgi:hypothetical protein
MDNSYEKDHLDGTIHPIKSFNPGKPPLKLINEIINAGKVTPCNLPESKNVENFREFFILEKGSTKSKKIVALLESNATKRLDNYEKVVAKNPFIKSKIHSPMRMLRMGVEMCVFKIKTAPYLVIVAEHRTVTLKEQEPLMDVLMNMELKATQLNLNLQLILLPCGNLPIISQMSGEGELMNLLGLPISKLALNGCVIGYPTESNQI